VTRWKILHRDDRFVRWGGRYRLIRIVAEDPLGQIWQGEDASLRAPVTIRIVAEALTEDSDRVDAFRRRLSALIRRLEHPNIAWVYAYGEEGPAEFVVMEDLAGQTLAQRLRQGPGLRAREGFGIAAAIARGLQAAHDLGFAHGALTADSIMLIDDGSVKIMDFGLAELRPPSANRPDSEGSAGDVLALGTLLRAMSDARLADVSSGDLRPGPGMGAELVRLWRDSLDPDPGSRPPAGALAGALGAAATGTVEPDPPPEPDPTPVEPPVEASLSWSAEDDRRQVGGETDGKRAERLDRADDRPAARGRRTSAGRSRRRALVWGSTLLGLIGVLVTTVFLVLLRAGPDAGPDADGPPAREDPAAAASSVMPDLRGLGFDEARLRLEESDLELGRRVKVQGEPGVVVATRPGLGQPVPPGAAVTLFVGADPEDEGTAARH
jgi:hypothetical protein